MPLRSLALHAYEPSLAFWSPQQVATLAHMSQPEKTKNSEYLSAFQEWISTIAEDVALLEAIVDNGKIDRQARLHAAAALNYLVSRMDLVPDWEKSVGLIDDLMVIRLCLELASQNRLDQGLEDSAHIIALGRLLNDGARIDGFLGEELSGKLRRYCGKLTDTAVRGRSCSLVLESKEERAKLYAEVAQDLKRAPEASFADPEALAVKFKSYLAHKLKN